MHRNRPIRASDTIDRNGGRPSTFVRCKIRHAEFQRPWRFVVNDGCRVTDRRSQNGVARRRRSQNNGHRFVLLGSVIVDGGNCNVSAQLVCWNGQDFRTAGGIGVNGVIAILCRTSRECERHGHISVGCLCHLDRDGHGHAVFVDHLRYCRYEDRRVRIDDVIIGKDRQMIRGPGQGKPYVCIDAIGKPVPINIAVTACHGSIQRMSIIIPKGNVRAHPVVNRITISVKIICSDFCGVKDEIEPVIHVAGHLGVHIPEGEIIMPKTFPVDRIKSLTISCGY